MLRASWQCGFRLVSLQSLLAVPDGTDGKVRLTPRRWMRSSARCAPLLKAQDFKYAGGRSTALTEDGLTQVVSIQMGASILRDNLHPCVILSGEPARLFTVNLGVYVPEVARHHGGGEARSWVQEYHCCVRARLGENCGEKQEIWWHARMDDSVVDDVQRALEVGGFPFLERFSSRDKILAEWHDRSVEHGRRRSAADRDGHHFGRAPP